MKKLMFAVAALAVGVVLADVTSANIVGYAPAELQESGLTAGACFTPVGGGDVDLVNLVVTSENKETGAEVSVQTLNEYGQTQGTYFWYDVWPEPELHVYEWQDEFDETVYEGDVSFQAGEGLWFYCTKAGFNLQSSGEVPQSTVDVELQESGLSIANPTPVTTDLTACVISSEFTESGADVSVQTLNEYGQTQGTYFWYDVWPSPGFHVYEWQDEFDETLDEGVVPVEPGAGLWTYCTKDGFTFVWPGVETK